MSPTGQISWRSVGLTARAVKRALYPNSRRKRQEGPAQRVGAYHSGGNASHPGPNNTAGQMGAAPSFHPEKGRATDGPQEKGGTGERNTQKKAQTIPGNREPRCTAPEHRASEQVPGKSQSCWKCSPAGPPGNTGGTKPKPSTENKPVDGSLGELGKQELQDPAKWAELLSRQCAKVAGSEQNPAERTAKEKEGDKSAPSAKEKVKQDDEKRAAGGGAGGGGDPGKPPGGGEDKRERGAETTYLTYSPVCCSCNRQGVEQLKFREEHQAKGGEVTFCTRIIREGSTTRLGICLMVSNTGLVRTSKGKLCGHIVCPRCLVTKQDRAMCPCCARRLEAQGAAKGGAGPLPRKESQAAAEVKEEPPRSEEEDKAEGERKESKRRRRSTSDSRAPRARRRVREPSSEEEEEEPTPPPSEGEGDRDRKGGRERASSPGRRDRNPEPEEMEDVLEEQTSECIISCCHRWTQPGFDTCCEPCEASRGKRHSQMCDRLNKRDPPPPRREYDSDEEGRDKDKRGKGKGKGKGGWKGGKGGAQKNWKRYERDKQRWRTWQSGKAR